MVSGGFSAGGIGRALGGDPLGLRRHRLTGFVKDFSGP
jgi:hypothetical protein